MSGMGQQPISWTLWQNFWCILGTKVPLSFACLVVSSSQPCRSKVATPFPKCLSDCEEWTCANISKQDNDTHKNSQPWSEGILRRFPSLRHQLGCSVDGWITPSCHNAGKAKVVSPLSLWICMKPASSKSCNDAVLEPKVSWRLRIQIHGWLEKLLR